MYARSYYDIRKGIEDDYNFDVVANPNKILLRDYQVVGRNWLRDKERAFLTDKPGLGKTVQSAEAAVRPVLVSAPTYLTNQWYDFLRAQYPHNKVVLATGGKLHRFDRTARLKKKADWYIINHDMWRSFDMPQGIRTVIIDESHHFRNRTALRSIRAAKFTSNMSLRVYNLTATPMWKNADDIWMQLHILQPELFSSYKEFVDYFLITDDSPYGTKVLGVNRAHRKELDHILNIVAFGRTYKDVGRVLPDTIISDIKVEFPSDLMKLYNDVKKNYQLQLEEDETLIFTSYMEVLHTLRMFTNFPGKQEAVLGRIEDVGKPYVIFVWYKDTAHELGKVLLNSIVLTGDIEPGLRHKKAMDAMRKKKHVIATMSSLAEGINLQDYRCVMFYEEDWPPGRNFQALSRVVRDRNDEGKDTEPVLVDYVYVEKSVDENIHMVAKRREATIKEVMRDVLL